MDQLRHPGLLIFLFVSLTYFSCDRRNDEIFSATDELHFIRLFDKGQEFEILYNGVDKAKGIFYISGDTIFLTYNEDEAILHSDTNSELGHANDILTRVLLI